MKKVEVFEHALCCSTGVCGPSVKPELITITLVSNKLKDNPDIEFNRYNLNTDTEEFVKNPKVIEAMHKKDKSDKLPITLVDDEIVKTGSYPTVKEYEEYTGVSLTNIKQEVK
ncbi:arsenite efflux transporter metallochaperone ArsD [Companilactobacillus mishanensis]|uniref:Arsenite efflux transporter metallochaperone ArsD n=1 Tax=Companilactobacillus mishanensis TaxID=2486008 RepID=A0A5P0ZJS8_9LACO|nr:arsenite efflux transporter metallochaperone ArsD [Companilactobacillus mishanensis]MQS44543.1 arsenite efflux transporter metallochaperone ArsD [Companilactobacillus mishanensis]MQS53339.1 arsenite efflux transporter metallochaperone ArsD [Companilactobacillus mishanensis]MQS88781.1 arsenite efflux transporter metallochaperone ArsD [Companilactobacillus mishanensis]